MTTFKGYGAGKGTWTKRTYGPESVKAAKRGPGIHTRFVPFVDFGCTEAAAKRHGLERTPNKGTYFRTERQLNEYLATEKGHGREMNWKDW